MKDNNVNDLILFEIRKRIKFLYPVFGKSLINKVSKNILPMVVDSKISLEEFLNKELIEQALENSKLGKQFLQNIQSSRITLENENKKLKLLDDVKKDYPKSYRMISLSINKYSFESYFLNLTKGLRNQFPKELYLRVSSYSFGTKRHYIDRGYKNDSKFVKFGNQLVRNQVIDIGKLFNLCSDEFKNAFHLSLINFAEFKHLNKIKDVIEYLKNTI